ncbi:MAG: DUF1178 family protein [Candidatus Dactylopiibacterium sp.]|nr:DUF1178 family protein [Candidatus Dactylopiibacterium sp.]
MIVLDLLCDAGHRFEGWFASSEAFEQQRGARQVSCPLCNGSEVRRLPSAPHVQRATPSTPTTDAGPAQLIDRLREVARLSEDVGERFPDEARRIHYGEAEARSIRGQASARETRALLDEGIVVLPVPADKDDLH